MRGSDALDGIDLVVVGQHADEHDAGFDRVGE